jgi:hypothetical protein
MKKLALLMLMALSVTSCSWFRSSTDWANNTFFGGDDPNAANSNYPYYYSASAPIDAKEENLYGAGMPPAAPGTVPVGNQQYMQQPMAAPQPQYQAPQQPAYGGYGVQNNGPTTSFNYGSKGTSVQTAPQQPVQNSQPQYQQVAPQQAYQPYQPYHAPQQQPAVSNAQQRQQSQPQGAQPMDQYQQLYYGQQYPQGTYQGQYQYPPMPK